MKLKINESALDNSTVDAFRSAFLEAENYIDFYYCMSEEQVALFNTLGIKIKDLYTELSNYIKKDGQYIGNNSYASVSEIYNYSVKLHDVSFEFVTARSGGWQADANDDSTINVRDDVELPDYVLVHELGHIVLNQNIELENIVITNPDNVFGIMRKSRNGVPKFDGAYGCYNSEEAFADSFSYFFCYPNNLKSNYPEIYDVMRKLVDNNKSIKQWLKRQLATYYAELERFRTGGEDV